MKDDTDKHPPNTTTITDTDSATLTAQCPLCSTPISNTILEEFTIRHTTNPKTKPSQHQPRLPSRLQQKFCRDHRARSALETWQTRGYPVINWDQLANTRTTRHLPALRSILTNQTASPYRAQLAAASTTTTTLSTTNQKSSSRRNLLKYLQDGLLDVVRYGYYGPRGAKVAAEAITSRLSADLLRGLQMDGLVRDAGVAGFVQAVLVPELLGRWVAEDRGLRLETGEWEEEVRDVLEESCEIGLLLNEDEDRVLVEGDAGGGGRGEGGSLVIDL